MEFRRDLSQLKDFQSLDLGDVFEVGGKIYIKVEPLPMMMNAVSIQGYISNFSPETSVIPHPKAYLQL